MVQEDGPRANTLPPNSRSSKANTGNKAADRLSRLKHERQPQKRKVTQKAKQPQARKCLDGAPRHLAKWSAVKASNSPDGRADKLNQDLV